MNYRLIVIILTLHAPGIFSMEGDMQDAGSEFNYLVSIWHQCAELCSGVLIHKRHVLTAAHCLIDISIPHLIVLVGGHRIHSSYKEGMKRVHSVWLHPQSRLVFKPFKPDNYYWRNDIAVIKLKDELIRDTTFGFANVVINNMDWYELREFTMLGWHHDLMALFQGMSSGLTRGIFMSELECLHRKTNLLQNEKCIHAPVVLNHDEGSPLIYNDAVIGIIVSGGSAFGEPVTVLPIAPYMNFIKSVMLDRTDVYHDEFRYVASIWHNGNLECGGSIVDAFHIVTTATCVHGIELSLLRVVVGKSELVSYLDVSIEWLEVDEIVHHPSFNEYWLTDIQSNRTIWHDIAIIRLKRPLIWSPTVGQALFLKAINPPPELYYHVIQFDMSIIAEIATHIQLRLSSAITQSDKLNNLNLKENQFVLVGADTLRISNNYDRGNPVICNGFVFGIVAQTMKSDETVPYIPTIVLSTYHYTDFIQSVISGS